MDVAQNAPDTVLLAEDEASLYLQTTLTAVWAVQGQTPVVRSDPSRTKTNFYGALNLQTGIELTMRTEKMNAETTAAYLEQILKAIPDRPILLFWDRAPWHRGVPIRLVLEANPRLELMIFPVAAPELNPQEHVWKATRRQVGHNHDQPHLPKLADRFQQHLNSTNFPSSFLDCYGYTAILPRFI